MSDTPQSTDRLAELGLSEKAIAKIHASVAEAPPLPEETRRLIRRLRPTTAETEHATAS